MDGPFKFVMKAIRYFGGRPLFFWLKPPHSANPYCGSARDLWSGAQPLCGHQINLHIFQPFIGVQRLNIALDVQTVNAILLDPEGWGNAATGA